MNNYSRINHSFKKLLFFMMSIFMTSFFLFTCKSDPQNPTETASTEFIERSRNDINKPSPMGNLCIYYGYPSLINNVKGDLEKALQEFSKFHLIVFGNGLWMSNHPDNKNTQVIIDGLLSKKRLVFGYVDLGMTPQTFRLSEDSLRIYINGWKKMGINGIFLDDAGYDYSVTRARQNTVITYCKSLGLKVFINAWNPNDVLDGQTLLNEEDYYLYESIIVGHDKYYSLDFWKSKSDLCYNYMLKKGIKIACVATGGESIDETFYNSDKFSAAWTGTAIYNFHYFQATNIYYSANNNRVYFFKNLSNNYGKQWKQKDIILKESSVHYFRNTDTHTLHIYGGNNNESFGKISQP